MSQLTVGTLFAGIGGFDLGFERAGMVTRWQVEQDEFCRKVLARHFPHAKRYEDVRDVGASNLERVDVVCGGFPCQDISTGGAGEGIEGSRSGLWSEYARIISEIRPRYVVVENVTALLVRGLERVLADLAACGYDAEWDCIPASAIGAPHRRDRLWLVAYPQQSGRMGANLRPRQEAGSGATDQPARSTAWEAEPGMGRVADGVPEQVDRLASLGNALIPQIAEWIGRRIIEWEHPTT